MKSQIVLDDDLYEGLHLSSLAFGGIGAGAYSVKESEGCGGGFRAPYCVLGHTMSTSYDDAERLLRAAGVNALVNDHAVAAINRRKGKIALYDRVTFEEWCEELNVVPRSAVQS